MTVLTDIKAAQLQARKDRNAEAAAVMTTLIGEAVAIGKNDGNRDTTDAEVVALIKKFIKNINELLSVVAEGNPVWEKAVAERDILSAYLPKQLSADQLKGILESMTNELNAHTLRDMGKIMKVLKERFDGQYDGAAASALIKGMLT